MPLVLIVDNTNQTRSPLCEALANALAAKQGKTGLVFDSCGWSVDYPERLSSGLREELERRKMTLDSFRTKRLEMALVEKATAIVCMHDEIAKKVREAYPLKASQVLSFGEVSALKGVSAQDYKNCADAVQAALERNWTKIVSLAGNF